MVRGSIFPLYNDGSCPREFHSFNREGTVSETEERITVQRGKGRPATVTIPVTLPEHLEKKVHGNRPEIYAMIEAVRELWERHLKVGWTSEEVREIVNGPPA